METNAKNSKKNVNELRHVNLIGQSFDQASEAIQKLFIEVAMEKAVELGATQMFDRKQFQQVDKFFPIANVRPPYLHAAHVVFGLNFNLTTRKVSSPVFEEIFKADGKDYIISVSPLSPTVARQIAMNNYEFIAMTA